MNTNRTAMIVAAGLGTRLQPLTNTLPKALVPIAGKPMLERIIIKLKNAGYNKIVINIHHFGDMIIDFIAQNNNFGIEICISDERAELLDTGGGIKHAEQFLHGNTPFLVHNVDVISDVDLNQIYEKHCATPAIATLLVSARRTMRYFLFDEENYLRGWQNKSTDEIKLTDNSKQINIQDVTRNYTEYAFNGVYVISPKIFDYLKNEPNKFSITGALLTIAKTENIYGYIQPNLRWLDIGKIEVLKQAEEEFGDLL